LGLTHLVLIAAGVAAADQGALGSDWAEIWRALQGVHSGEVAAESLSGEWAELPPGVRSEVVRHHQAIWSGAQPLQIPCTVLPELEVGGAWAFALAISRGPALDQALLRAIEETPQGLLRPIYDRAVQETILHSAAAQAAPALQLAEALYGRSRSVWSAQNLALARTRAGAYGEAASLLEGFLLGELGAADRDLLGSIRALVLLGEGGHLRARASLGKALSRGGSDSGIVLGLLSLEIGHTGRSRALFRAALSRDPERPWAGRGWGLSMVPR